MGKKRPKSKTVKQQDASSATRESAASESQDDKMIATAISTATVAQTVLMKVCRLCETKDGPFLNVFDADKVTAKKIEEVMPFGIAENDDLPHKICFRCSAKVEELYEFIQKCIKTQHSLRTAAGKRIPLVTKTKNRMLWEEKLNKTNLSNEDICNALIKKAMEGIKDIPENPLPSDEEKPPNKKIKINTEPTATSKKDRETAAISSKNNIIYQSDDEPGEVSLKRVKLTVEKCDEKLPLTRTSRSNKSENLLDGLVESSKRPKQYPSRKSQTRNESAPSGDLSTNNKINETSIENQSVSTVVSNSKNKAKVNQEKSKVVPAVEVATPPPINIMDHVSTIKVNDVGTLFLCKLCNRNFLKKEVVMTHGCAKNNVPKDRFMQNHVPPPEVPKPSTVKYIKMDKDFKKAVTETKTVEKKTLDANKVNISVRPESKLKVTAGPSSKLKPAVHSVDVSKNSNAPPANPKVSQESAPVIPSVQFPSIPSLNSRYKLVPGPNNTFSLVEEPVAQNEEKSFEGNIPALSKITIKRTNTTILNSNVDVTPLIPSHVPRESSPEIIDLDDNIPSEPPAMEQPYPVGLFQTVPHHSGVFTSNNHPKPPAFTTPAMKKQSYTIVQTGNPSKLLISTKPQPVTEEPQRKKSKKNKPEVGEIIKNPYNVTIEDNSQPKDAGFFTFINVDPLLQPSYVLPTDSIIQESQISTSTPGSRALLDGKEKGKDYSCNMCEEKFSREKKLLAHIQSHYNQMDEEDQLRAKKSGPKRKTRKS